MKNLPKLSFPKEFKKLSHGKLNDTAHPSPNILHFQHVPARRLISVYICDATTGDPGGALVMGGGGLMREPGETADAFTARASDGVSGAVYFSRL
jgi:hypothetical protein